LAPSGLKWRILLAIVTVQACAMVPIANTSFAGLYASVFGVMLPVLIAMWLSSLWLLRALSESLVGHR
jgi:hypothetical protein